MASLPSIAAAIARDKPQLCNTDTRSTDADMLAGQMRKGYCVSPLRPKSRNLCPISRNLLCQNVVLRLRRGHSLNWRVWTRTVSRRNDEIWAPFSCGATEMQEKWSALKRRFIATLHNVTSTLEYMPVTRIKSDLPYRATQKVSDADLG